jgi:hypothetical protein
MLSQTYESILLPCNALLLVRIGIREALHLASFTAEQTVQIWTDLVTLALLQCMALGASGLWDVSGVRELYIVSMVYSYLEEVGTLLGVA